MHLIVRTKRLTLISYSGKRDYSEVRWEQYNKLISWAKEQELSEIQKPVRFGAGQTMTIAVVDHNYLFGDGKIDMDDLVGKLKRYQSLIDLCCKG